MPAPAQGAGHRLRRARYRVAYASGIAIWTAARPAARPTVTATDTSPCAILNLRTGDIVFTTTKNQNSDISVLLLLSVAATGKLR
jgi:hypothetical protein